MTRTGTDTQASRADQVLAALSEIYDPCSVGIGSPLSLTDMGLVGRIEIDGDLVRISLVLTQPDCWFFFDITKHIEGSLAHFEWVREIDVQMDDSTIWTPDRYGVAPVVHCSPQVRHGNL